MWQSLSKWVRQVLCRCNICYNHIPMCNNFFEEMILVLNVFFSLVISQFLKLCSHPNVIGDYPKHTTPRCIKNFLNQTASFASSQVAMFERKIYLNFNADTIGTLGYCLVWTTTLNPENLSRPNYSNPNFSFINPYFYSMQSSTTDYMSKTKNFHV